MTCPPATPQAARHSHRRRALRRDGARRPASAAVRDAAARGCATHYWSTRTGPEMPTIVARNGKMPLPDVFPADVPPPLRGDEMNRRIACVSSYPLVLCLVSCALASAARAQTDQPGSVLEGRPDAEPRDVRGDGADASGV